MNPIRYSGKREPRGTGKLLRRTQRRSGEWIQTTRRDQNIAALAKARLPEALLTEALLAEARLSKTLLAVPAWESALNAGLNPRPRLLAAEAESATLLRVTQAPAGAQTVLLGPLSREIAE